MTRTAYKGGILVVEGPSDAGFFLRRLAEGPQQVIVAGSKPTVCGAVSAAYAAGLVGIVGVVDDDYDSVCGVLPATPHILSTDTRDLETLLLSSPALDALLHEVADRARLLSLERAEGCTVREALLSRALIFGKLRLLNRLHAWNLTFDDFKPWRFADKENWLIDESAVITLAAAKLGISVADIQSLLAKVPVKNPYSLVQGRDLLAVLQIGLRRRLGNESFSIDNLCRMLRLAFTDQIAMSYALFQGLRAWEATNPPYRILI